MSDDFIWSLIFKIINAQYFFTLISFDGLLLSFSLWYVGNESKQNASHAYPLFSIYLHLIFAILYFWITNLINCGVA